MTYNQFFKKATEISDTNYYPNYEIKVTDDKLIFEWESGGMSGGSCWGHKPKKYNKSKPNFSEFDKFLENICPEISFLQYKRLMNLFQKGTSKQKFEYYGNFSEYQNEYINLKDFYKFLTEEELI